MAAPDADDPDAVEGPEELGGRIARRRLEMFAPGRLDNARRFVAFAGTTSALWRRWTATDMLRTRTK